MPITRAYAQAAEPGNFFVAGKNKIINGDFGIWQRGTSFTGTATNGFAADRFKWNTGSSGTSTVSQQTFTPGTAPVAGYEGQYFLRHNRSTASTTVGNGVIWQQVEDVRTFAGQTTTFSFWAKAGANKNFKVEIETGFGTGGSAGATVFSETFAVTTSWQRFTFTTTMPSVSGKTIGTGSSVYLIISEPATLSTFTLDTWGWQWEAGAVATPFITATGTLAGELAACQRYFHRVFVNTGVAGGYADTTTRALLFHSYATMRTAPTLTVSAGDFRLRIQNASSANATAFTLDTSTVDGARYDITVASGLTAGSGVMLDSPGSSGGSNKSFDLSSEL